MAKRKATKKKAAKKKPHKLRKKAKHIGSYPGPRRYEEEEEEN